MNQTHFPVKHFANNLVFNIYGMVFAFYEINNFSYAYRSDSSRLDLHQKLKRFFSTASCDMHLLMLPETLKLDTNQKKLSIDMDPKLLDIGCKHIDETLAYLEGREVFKYRYFVGIKLPQLNLYSSSTSLEMKYLLKDFQRYLLKCSGIANHDFFKEEVELYKEQEDLLFNKIAKELDLSRVTTKDIEWLIRRNFYRGINDTPIREDWEPSIDNPNEVLSLAEGRFSYSDGKGLSIEQYHNGDFQKGYMSFMAVASMPNEVLFPGTEWLYILHNLPFPVDVSVRTKYKEYNSFLSKIISKQNSAKDNSDSDQLSFLKTTISFCVSAFNEKVLHLRLQMLRDLYADINIELALPYGEQWRSFNNFIPGICGYSSDYSRFMAPDSLAASMFGATTNIGHDQGYFIGTSENSSVLLNYDMPKEINDCGKNISALFVGDSGCGKSFAANLLTYQAFLNGAKVLIFDSKDERSHWIDSDLKEVAAVIKLGQDENNNGALDPLFGLNNLQDRLEAGETVKRIMQTLSNASDGTYEAAVIGKAVDFVIKHETNPSMMKVLNSLSEGLKSNSDPKYTQLQIIVESLQELAKSPHGKLLFADKVKHPIDLSKSLTILQIADLKLGTAQYHKILRALTMAIADFCKRFYREQTNKLKLVLFEDIDQLCVTREGRFILDDLIRSAHTSKSIIYITSKGPNNLLDPHRFGYHFIFKLRERQDALYTCTALDIGASDINLDLICNFLPGVCFMMDNACRINKFKFTVLNENLMRLFSKKPTTSSKEIASDKIEALDLVTVG